MWAVTIQRFKYDGPVKINVIGYLDNLAHAIESATRLQAGVDNANYRLFHNEYSRPEFRVKRVDKIDLS